MAEKETLRGGTGNESGGKDSKLEQARWELARKRPVQMTGSPGDQAKSEINGAAFKPQELADYVNQYAIRAYHWILNVARLFFWTLLEDCETIGEEVRLVKCVDSDITKDQQETAYEQVVDALLVFGPTNDPETLGNQAQIPHLTEYVNALCPRVRYLAELALLVDKIRHANDKADLEGILTKARENHEKNARFVFKKVDGETPIRAFGQGYDLIPGVFGRFNDFAKEQLGEAVPSRATQLKSDHEVGKEEKAAEQKVVVAESQPLEAALISVEELFFGKRKVVNGRRAWIRWRYGKYTNGLLLEAAGNQLIIIDSEGGMDNPVVMAVEAMKEQYGPKPKIFLNNILDPDQQHLCLDDGNEGKPHYDFGEYIGDSRFLPTCFIRAGAGECIPDRLWPKNQRPDQKKREVVAIEGRDLTSAEFFDESRICLGSYPLVVMPFIFENKREGGKKYPITGKAIAWIQRMEASGRIVIALEETSTQELANLLKAGGAEIENEYPEGTTKRPELPLSLRLIFNMARKRYEAGQEKEAPAA